jgi:hypothetical protein
MMLIKTYFESFKRIGKHLPSIITAALFFAIQIILGIIDIAVIEKNETVFVMSILFALETFVLALFVLVFFTLITLKLFHYDIKDGLYRIELNNGINKKTAFFSRIGVVMTYSLLFFAVAFIIAGIFYGANHRILKVAAFQFLIQPILFTWIFAYIAFSVVLFLIMVFDGRMAGTIAAIILTIIIMVSAFGGSIVKPAVDESGNIGDVSSNKLDANNYFHNVYVASEVLKFKDQYDQDAKITNFIAATGDANNYTKADADRFYRDVFPELATYMTEISQQFSDTFMNQPLTTDSIEPIYDALITPFMNSKIAILKTIGSYLQYHTYYAMYDFDFNENRVAIDPASGISIRDFVYIYVCSNVCYLVNEANESSLTTYEYGKYNDLKSKIVMNTALNPLAHLSQMFFGYNYIEPKVGQILTSKGAPFSSPITIVGEFAGVQEGEAYTVTFTGVNAKQAYPIQVNICLWFVVLVAIDCVLYFRFKKKN